MDLAKIRQKSIQELDRRDRVDTPRSPVVEAPAPGMTAAAVPVSIMPAEQMKDTCEEIPPAVVQTITACPQEPAPPHRVTRDPLEAILAGRMLAGCDRVMDDEATGQTGVEVAGYHEYLCFRVSDEIYGVNIMEIKELIRPREVTEVPRAPSFVPGIISLRGVIIPIIDMRDRLGLNRRTENGRERVIVVRHGDSFSGLLVDEIIQVVRVDRECIEAAPTVLEGIDRDFVTGIGRAAGRMIILLNILNITDIELY